MIVNNSKSCGKSICEITGNSKCVIIEENKLNSNGKNRKYVTVIELNDEDEVLTRDMLSNFSGASKVIIPDGIVKIGV